MLEVQGQFNSFTQRFGSLKIEPPDPELKLGEEFGTIDIDGNLYPLAVGNLPHSPVDKYHYAKIGEDIVPFNGRRKLFRIEIAEHNCFKRHPIEITKGCSVKVYVDGLEVWQKYCKDRRFAADLADRYILDMENYWDWFPLHLGDYLGRKIGYENKESEIVQILVSKSRLIIKTTDDSRYPRRLDEDLADYLPSSYKEISILDPAIAWEIYP